MLPAALAPMQPVSKKDPFDHPDYIFQIKWDGVRLLSLVEEGSVRLQNRRLRDRSDAYPELLFLPELLRADGVVLDGEVIVPGVQGANFPAILRREQAATKQRAVSLAREIPVCYLVFDLLFKNGKSIMNQPLVERQRQLEEVLTADSIVYPVENFPSGRQLFAAAKELGWEGIVAKHKKSPYLSGVRSKAWQKIKVRRQQLCVVGGYLTSGTKLRSLLVGAWQGERLVFLGKVGAGLTVKEASLLQQKLPQLATLVCPFAPSAALPEAQWIQPVLPVIVEFSEWTEQLRLRAPSIVEFPQIDPKDCRLEG